MSSIRYGDTEDAIMNIEIKLGDLEEETIEEILSGKIEGHKETIYDHATVAYAVWFNMNENRIEHGRVRWGHRKNWITNEGREDTLSCSPFPGAWTDVPISRIIRVTHHRAF